MNKDVVLKVGTQVAYVPSHVREECGDDWDRMIEHDDTEFGFVSSWRDGSDSLPVVFCRFWSKHWMAGIRTVANSEGCEWKDLELYNSHADFEVQKVIERFRGNPEEYGWREQGEVQQ